MYWFRKCPIMILDHIKSTLVAGLLIIIPVVVTYWILRFVFDAFDPLVKPVFEEFSVNYKPGMGIAALVVIIYLAGLVTLHVLGRRMIRLAHAAVDMIPVVRTVYGTARQAMEVFTSVKAGGKFTGVVLVDFPGYGLKSIGLVTSRIKDQDGNNLLAVYMPTSPFPTSGFTVILPENQVTPTDIPVDDAMKLIVSAGIVSPEEIKAFPRSYGTFTTGDFPTPDSDKDSQAQDSENRISNQ